MTLAPIPLVTETVRELDPVWRLFTELREAERQHAPVSVLKEINARISARFAVLEAMGEKGEE